MASSRRRCKIMSSSSSSREISTDMLRQIVLKLPTKDAARCCCVSKLWGRILGDPSFRNVHAMANQVTSARTEALLVTERREPGCSDEASVFNLSSAGKAMCCVPIPSGYGLANICNGFLCFRYGRDDGPEAPVVLCNPATGDTVALPKAPPLIVAFPDRQKDYMFALGFSPSTKEYKLFRLSYPYRSLSSDERVELDVYSLGDAPGRWRRRSFISPYSPAKFSAPVSIDGKIYVVTVGWMHRSKHENPRRLLAIDVATESCCIYHLPEYKTVPYEQPTVGAFELNGHLCFVAHIINLTDFKTIHFWVMSPPKEDMDLEQQPSWDLRYSFHMENEPFCFSRPWGCWLDDNDMMCYQMDETMHKYDTRNVVPSISKAGFLQWNKKLHLPIAPTRSKCLWNVYGGYRPTLLSPLTFSVAPSQQNDGDKHQFEHNMVSAIRDM